MAYNLLTARRDLLAGITVAAISLPQAMAYALIAGVDPRFGLYSAIVVTFVASVFGSSSHLINGPTNAISLVVFSALAYFDPDARLDAYQATFLLAIMVGILQILVAVFRLGDLTRYISESVVIGFMAGAGSLVALTQIGNLLGLRDKGTGHQHVLERIWNTLTQGGPVNLRAAGIALGSIVLVVLLRAVVRRYRLPQLDMLATLIITSAAAGFLGWSLPDGSGKTLLAIVGSVPASLPLPHIPEIHFAWIKDLGAARWRSPSSACWRRWRSPSRSRTIPGRSSIITGSARPRGWPTCSAASSNACRGRGR
jgi:SulP family sulfate permease